MPQHLALPLRLSTDGRLMTLEQDSPEEIAQSVALLISTHPGERRSVPGFGVADQLGTGLDPAAIDYAVQEWEDRADPDEVDLIVDELTRQQAAVIPANPADAGIEEV